VSEKERSVPRQERKHFGLGRREWRVHTREGPGPRGRVWRFVAEGREGEEHEGVLHREWGFFGRYIRVPCSFQSKLREMKRKFLRKRKFPSGRCILNPSEQLRVNTRHGSISASNTSVIESFGCLTCCKMQLSTTWLVDMWSFYVGMMYNHETLRDS
jgi:hypothetical protein